MGYDLYGNAPKSERGAYFRASIFGWGPIMDIVEAVDVLPIDVLENMHFNDGQMLTDEQATELADAIEKYIGDVEDDMEYIATGKESMIVQMASSLIGALQAAGATVEPGQTMSSTNAGHIKEFVEFCRDSGGFQVW